jgi:hypothetical protein
MTIILEQMFFYANWLKNEVRDQKRKKNQNRGVKIFKIEGPKSQILQNTSGPKMQLNLF